MKKKKLFIITGAILGVALIFAASSFFIHRGAGIMDVRNFKAQAKSLQGQQLSVRGHVAPGSVNWNEKTQVVTFTLADDGESLDITYRGSLPNNFKPGAVLEVQGTYRPDGIFEAQSFGRQSSFCAICHG